MVGLVRFFDRTHFVDTPNCDRVRWICTIDGAFQPNVLAELHSKMPVRNDTFIGHIHSCALSVMRKHRSIFNQLPDHIYHNRLANSDATRGSSFSSTAAGRVKFHVRTFVMGVSKNSHTNLMYAHVNCDNRHR